MTKNVAVYLASILSWTVGANLFHADFPDDAAGSYDTAVCLTAYAGNPPQHQLGVKAPAVRFPGLNVKSRSKSYDTAYSRIISVRDTLDGLTNTAMNGTTYKCFLAQQEPSYLGRDDNARHLFSINFIVTV